jgi:hypothetical protein
MRSAGRRHARLYESSLRFAASFMLEAATTVGQLPLAVKAFSHPIIRRRVLW